MREQWSENSSTNVSLMIWSATSFVAHWANTKAGFGIDYLGSNVATAGYVGKELPGG